MAFILTLIVYFILSLVVGSAASQRGRSAFVWFLFAILTTPLLAGFFLLLFPSLNDPASVDDRALRESVRRGNRIGYSRGPATIAVLVLLAIICLVGFAIPTDVASY
jgi:hypothetical protein